MEKIRDICRGVKVAEKAASDPNQPLWKRILGRSRPGQEALRDLKVAAFDAVGEIVDEEESSQ